MKTTTNQASNPSALFRVRAFGPGLDGRGFTLSTVGHSTRLRVAVQRLNAYRATTDLPIEASWIEECREGRWTEM